MGGSPGELSEELVTQEKQKKGWRMSCDVGEVTERLENELCSAHSPTFPSIHLHHSSFSNPSVAYLRRSSFSNPSVASPTSQLFLQPYFRFSYFTGSSLTSQALQLRHRLFSYVTGSSLTSPGEPPMLSSLFPHSYRWNFVLFFK